MSEAKTVANGTHAYKCDPPWRFAALLKKEALKSALSHIHDPLISPLEKLGLRKLRGRILRNLSGNAVDLGTETGRDFPLCPPTVEGLTGIDPDEVMLRRAEKRAREACFPVEIIPADAET